MADDTTNDQHQDPTTEEVDTDSPDVDADDTGTPETDTDAADEDGEADAFAGTPFAAGAGQHALGVLRLSYSARDVDVVLDFDAARRLMTMIQYGSTRALQDPLDDRANGYHGWVIARIDEVLAASWTPGLPDVRRARMASVDPPLPAS